MPGTGECDASAKRGRWARSGGYVNTCIYLQADGRFVKVSVRKGTQLRPFFCKRNRIVSAAHALQLCGVGLIRRAEAPPEHVCSARLCLALVDVVSELS